MERCLFECGYSSCQQNYGDLFHISSIYTPQIVVNGKVQFVGSDETTLRATIENDLKEIPKTELQIKVQPGNKNQLAVSWTTNPNPELKMNLARVQNFAKDHIQKGENKGQTLNHYFTVRDFQSLPVNTGSNISYLNVPAGLQPSRMYRQLHFYKIPKPEMLLRPLRVATFHDYYFSVVVPISLINFLKIKKAFFGV